MEQCDNWKKSYKIILKFLFSPRSPTPHTIVELSRSCFKRYRDNMIILSDIEVRPIPTSKKSIENRYCFYKDVVYGKNVHMKCEMKEDAIQAQTIELDRMKNNHVLIVAKLSELEVIFPNRLILIPSQPVPKKAHKNRWQHGSGYVMICRALLEKKQASDRVFWDSKDLQMLISVKKSIVGNKSTPHLEQQDNTIHLVSMHCTR